MHEITVTTFDQELIRKISEIDENKVEFRQVILDDAASPEIIIACVGLASALISLLAAILPIIAKSNKSLTKKSYVYIRTSEITTDLKNLASTHKEEIKIEIIDTSE